MTEQEIKDFLGQFDKARDDFKTWPQWMQDAAVERAAAFPRAVGVNTCGRCGGTGEVPNWSTANGMLPCPTCAHGVKENKYG